MVRNNLENRIREIKTSISKARQEKAEAEGELKGILKRLKDEFQVKNLDQARDLLEEMREKVLAMENELEDMVDQLEDELESGDEE